MRGIKRQTGVQLQRVSLKVCEWAMVPLQSPDFLSFCWCCFNGSRDRQTTNNNHLFLEEMHLWGSFHHVWCAEHFKAGISCRVYFLTLEIVAKFQLNLSSEKPLEKKLIWWTLRIVSSIICQKMFAHTQAGWLLRARCFKKHLLLLSFEIFFNLDDCFERLDHHSGPPHLWCGGGRIVRDRGLF